MSDANVAMVWGHLKTAVARNPALGVVLALLVPLVGAAAVFLAPFATPLMIAYYVKTRRARADAEADADADAGASDADKDGASVASVATSASAAKPPAATPPAAPPPPADAAAADPASAAPAPLTGSAALMAKMRKSGAVTGEKRAKDPSSAAAASRASDAPAPGAAAPTSDLDDPNGSRLFFLHGGEASVQIARDLAEKATARGLDPRVVAMDDFKRCDLDKRPAVAIFVVETVENAQPAEAAGACLRFYNRKRKAGDADFLRGKLRYAVLALGDTNLLLDRQTTTAKDCNQAGQTLDSALKFLGAERVVARCEANDAVGLEEAVEPWCESLWAPLADAVAAIDTPAKASASDAAGAPRARVRFLFGSQTGNAAEICKAMAAEASSERGFDASCCAMNETEVGEVLKPGNVVVYVVSSTGDGDAPDNCDAFFTRLKRAAKKEPGACGSGVQYAVLGLGDQNYSAFMAVPRSFTMAMEKAGAHAFYPRGEADDTLGLHEYCEKWQEGLWAPLAEATARAPEFAANPAEATQAANAKKAGAKKTGAESGGAETKSTPQAAGAETEPTAAPSSNSNALAGVPALPACRAAVDWLSADADVALASYPLGTRDASDAFTPERPYLAAVSARRLLTDPKSDRRVIHAEFDLTAAGAGGAYQPGDSVGVLPRNDPELVSAVAARLGLDLDATFTLRWKDDAAAGAAGSAASAPLPHVRCPATVRDALTHAVDLTSQPRKSLLRVLAEACGEDVDRDDLLLLCSRGGKAAYAERVVAEQPTLLDLLTSHPSCAPGFAELLDATQPLQPRMYSVAAAPETAPGKPCVAFSVVRHVAPSGAERRGVATNWLDRGAFGEDSASFLAPIFVKRSAAFTPPEDVSAPVIMIGPGTGVAPFRGFLQRRRAQIARGGVAPGPCWLFFGCRRAEEDYLYREDLESFAADGTLTELSLAFSRETEEKVYVQRRIAERAGEVGALIAAPNARVFVCGDGAGMAKDVHAALAAALAGADGRGEAEAMATLAAMTKEGRYVRDIWS